KIQLTNGPIDKINIENNLNEIRAQQKRQKLNVLQENIQQHYDLEKAFEHSNKSILTPEVPELFKGAIECSNQGFQKLYNSYDIGINRSNDIFKQDIERSVVRDTTGKNNNECEYKDEYKKYTGECKTQ
ncbi:5771_t:CDS:2, partial [Entrophospora sp. SA101]